MSNWNEHQINQVKIWLGNDCICKFAGFNNTQAQINIKESETERFDLILGYDIYSNIYAAWNPYLYYPKKKYSVSIPYMNKNEFNGFFSFYTSLRNGKSEYGKKIIIQPSFLETFCKNWQAFLKPYNKDLLYTNHVIWADKYHPIPDKWENFSESNQEISIRDKEIITRYHREFSFRKLIISKYKQNSPPCCVICRCEIEELLEAAHIKPVSEGGKDVIENGILLCRNHHKMLDEGMIKIHGDSLEIYNEQVKKMAWYKEFKDKYQNKIRQPDK